MRPQPDEKAQGGMKGRSNKNFPVKLDVAEFMSPIGPLTLTSKDGRLCALTFSDCWPRQRAKLEARFGEVVYRKAEAPDVASRLESYFRGALDELRSMDVDPGGTSFQRKVWSRLRSVRAGQTVSYRELARMIGCPKAVRAVGAANGANPIGIVIPCHRVITSSGGLGGYGGGIERKRWLLVHERSFSENSIGKQQVLGRDEH